MIRSVRGFQDILPPLSGRFARFEEAARRVCARYGYLEARLPTLEFEELFHKATGETTDIVEKEMFLLQDASGRKLALRPEGTPGLVRAILESNLHKTGGARKFFYAGSMFRAERPQAGRYREFEQIGVEALGNPHPAADAEAIALLLEVLAAAGVKKPRLHLNTLGDEKAECRPRYRQRLLEFLRGQKDSLCKHCQERVERNPLRALDCKGDGERIRAHAPKLEPCAECAAHVEEVRRLLGAEGIAFVWDPFLVRGLDYYTRTVFEAKAEGLGSQDTVGAGGRYDGLVESMGGPPLPAVGWALGVERALLAAGETHVAGEPPVFVASQGSESHGPAFTVLQQLRREGIAADGGLFDRSLKAQLREADQCGAPLVILLGPDEVASGSVTVRDMRDKGQVQVPRAEVVKFIRSRLEDHGS